MWPVKKKNVFQLDGVVAQSTFGALSIADCGCAMASGKISVFGPVQQRIECVRIRSAYLGI